MGVGSEAWFKPREPRDSLGASEEINSRLQGPSSWGSSLGSLENKLNGGNREALAASATASEPRE